MVRLGVVVLFLGGCVVDVGPQCLEDTDCAEGQMCNEVGLCRAPPGSGCVEGPACYEGPVGTEGVGQCHGGQLGCVNGAPVCEGAVGRPMRGLGRCRRNVMGWMMTAMGEWTRRLSGQSVS